MLVAMNEHTRLVSLNVLQQPVKPDVHIVGLVVNRSGRIVGDKNVNWRVSLQEAGNLGLLV